MLRVSLKTVILFCSVGVVVDYIFLLRHADASAILWNIVPYLIAAIIAPVWKNNCVMLSGVMLMLAADIWLIMEGILGFHTPFTLGLSLLITFKLITLFPIGALVGYLAVVRTKKCI